MRINEQDIINNWIENSDIINKRWVVKKELALDIRELETKVIQACISWLKHDKNNGREQYLNSFLNELKRRGFKNENK